MKFVKTNQNGTRNYTGISTTHKFWTLFLEYLIELRTAYYLKSDYVYFNKHSNLENAENDLWKHIEEMKKSNIQEILKLKKTLINWSQEIINSFTFIDGRAHYEWN